MLEISDDRESMNDTWKEWQIKKNEFKRNFSKFGMKVTEVKIDIDQLVLYCKLRGIPNNGASRAQFVQ